MAGRGHWAKVTMDRLAAGHGLDRIETPKPFDEVGAIIAFEQGDATPEEVIDLFAHLVKNGHAWTLQGMYGRNAASLIERGFISRTGEVLKYSEED